VLLVHGEPVRRPARRAVGHLGLRRRPRPEPDLRDGLRGPDRARGVCAGPLRPAAHQLSAPARRLLAQRRSLR
jgi:hypothetical protein